MRKALRLLLLLGYVVLGGVGAAVLGWALLLIPGIMAPASGGSAQLLLVIVVLPMAIAGGGVLLMGIFGAAASWKRLRNLP
jgi:hypothetical protein